MIQIAVLGFGTVGSGVVELIERNRESKGVEVKYILDIREFPDSPYKDRVVHDFDIILNDPEISIICETMGGKEPAGTFTAKALEKGISVCSSNKELVEARGPELLALAAEHNCSYMFEASVGGGIPIIRPLLTCLEQEKITSVMGILNGTTNYILTQMKEEGVSFEDALKQAQENGYAERNPEADIEGHDACRKIAILSSLVCGKTVKYEKISCEGITAITVRDFDYADKMGMSIRLLGMYREEEDGIYVRTAPFMVSSDNPLYGVRDVFNAILVHGETVDDVMFYGRGAGKLPTASAVAADVLACAASIGVNKGVKWDAEEMELADAGKEKQKFFVRCKADARSAAEAAFAIEKVIEPAGAENEFAFITEPTAEEEFAAKAAGIEGIIGRIRVLA